MKKPRKAASIGDDLIASMGEALAHARGEPGNVRVTKFEGGIEVKRIREKMGLTQDAFATILGTSLSGLRKWEQNQRQPYGPTRTLLQIMEYEPEVVLRAMGRNAEAASAMKLRSVALGVSSKKRPVPGRKKITA